MNDDRGNPIKIGDVIRITAWGYGATLDMVGKTGTVVGYTPTRIKVNGIYLGHEAVVDTMRPAVTRIIKAIDDRPLITADEAHAALVTRIDARRP